MRRIAIDMDEVMVDLILKHLALFNENYNEKPIFRKKNRLFASRNQDFKLPFPRCHS